MNGVRKAALLLLSLNNEDSAEVLKHLGDEMIEKIILEMSSIRSFSKEERDRLLKEFSEEIAIKSDSIHAGKDKAKELLELSLGKDKADFIFKKMERGDNTPFSFLNDSDPVAVYTIIQGESPQTIAIVLSFLDPKKSADILKQFPLEKQSAIATKLAYTNKAHPEAIANLEMVLKKKYEQRNTEDQFTNSGGAKVLANILGFLDKTNENHILENIEKENSELAFSIKENLYDFEDIFFLDKREMRLVVLELGTEAIPVLSAAVRGLSEEEKFHFYQVLSKNRISDIEDTISFKGKIPISEVEEARHVILKVAKSLEEKGMIVLKKQKEEYI